jgi:hypothetical protein
VRRQALALEQQPSGAARCCLTLPAD